MTQPRTTRTTTQRGYGHTHQKRRQALLRGHQDGTPCPWCGRPMYRNPQHNWDHQPLHADHTNPLAKGGEHADRLMCATCNKQRHSGDYDHLSPLHTGIPPEHWSKITIHATQTTTTHYQPTHATFGPN